MGKCVVCGKKGLFFRVNSFGRCKKCEADCVKEEFERKEQERKRRKEIEEKQREEAERIRKEREIKKEEEKTRLKNLVMIYNDINGYIFSIKSDEDCEEFIPEITRRIQCCDDFDKILAEAEKDALFREVLMEFTCSSEKYFNDLECAGLQCNLSNKHYIAKQVYDDPKEIIDSVIRNWSLLAHENRREWEKEKNSIEKAVAKKKRREEKSQKEELVIAKAELQAVKEIDISKFQNKDYPLLPDCVITDVETSGLIYNKNSIIEVAAIKIVNSKVVGIYNSLVHRDKKLDTKTTSLTGISTQMLQLCDKTIDTVIAEYKEFVGNLPLVGHNIKAFDAKFLNEAYKKVCNEELENECIDTMKLSYEYFIESKSHKLNDLADYAGVKKGTAHRALGDCETTLYLYESMMNIAAVSCLKWSKNGKGIDETDEAYPAYVKKKYPLGLCHIHHRKLVETGYLKQAAITEVLKTFKVPELKNILLENSLCVKGTKADLIDRIIKNIDMHSLELPVVYIPSPEGEDHYNKYNNAINEMAYKYLGIKQIQNSEAE